MPARLFVHILLISLVLYFFLKAVEFVFEFAGDVGVFGIVVHAVEFIRVFFEVKEFPFGFFGVFDGSFLIEAVGVVIDEFVLVGTYAVWA